LPLPPPTAALKVLRYTDEPVAMMRALRQRRRAGPPLFAFVRFENHDVVVDFNTAVVALNLDAIGALVR
jgi:hypothetical protein